MKKIGIVLVLIGIICCGSGAYLNYSDTSYETESLTESDSSISENINNTNTDVNTDTNEEKIISTTDIKDFSNYQSYQIDYAVSMAMEGNTYTYEMIYKIDKKSNIDYFYMYFNTYTYYSYVDNTNEIAYESLDNKEWSISEPSIETSEEALAIYIDIIKGKYSTTETSLTVTDNKDNSYDITGADDDSIITFIFDSNGYIKKVECYVVDSGDTSSVIMNFSNINNLSVTIPDSVKNNLTSDDYSVVIEEQTGGILASIKDLF